MSADVDDRSRLSVNTVIVWTEVLGEQEGQALVTTVVTVIG